MNILIDTNVVLDVLLRREPFFKESQLVLLAAEKQYITAFVSASAITDIYYVAYKNIKNNDIVCQLIKTHLLSIVEIAAVDGSIILKAIDANWDDFEDCVQYTVGESVDVDYIVTRNPKDFDMGNINVVLPKDFLAIILQN